jgi:hypothetical protein
VRSNEKIERGLVLALESLLKCQCTGLPWHLLGDTQHFFRINKVLGGSNIPSDVKGFTNATMAWMPESGHGMDGRLADASCFTSLVLA